MYVATRTDADAMSALDMLLFPQNSFNEHTLAWEIEAGYGLVAYNASKLVGYVLTRWDGTLLDVIRLGVDPDHQRRNYGTRLLTRALDVLRPQIAMLCVHKDNQAAQRLYSHCGFHITSQLHNSWIMQRTTSAL